MSLNVICFEPQKCFVSYKLAHSDHFTSKHENKTYYVCINPKKPVLIISSSYKILHSQHDATSMMYRSVLVFFNLVLITHAVLFGSEGGCGSFGCKCGGCTNCDPPPPCASAPPPPPLPCDSCGRRKRDTASLVSKNDACTHDKLKEIIEKSFHSDAAETIRNLNSTLHHSDQMLILCSPRKDNSMIIAARVDHYCLHEDGVNACYVFGTGVRAKEV